MTFKTILKKAALFFVPSPIKRVLGKLPPDSHLCYSHEGEDIILQLFLQNRPKGFFVDVGAHHPTRFSNTYLFYIKGWRGINIEAMPGSMTLFNKLRPEDINIEKPISDKAEPLTYYIFNEPALNTFSSEEAAKKDGLRDYKVKEKVELMTETLSNILDTYLSEGQEIDFLTVDVEGMDLKVIQSNNWEKYRPEYVLVEELESDLETVMSESPVYKFMRGVDYKLVARSYNTCFYSRIN
jgi:FkbM family methyltransferase